jgi:hypothetical protein
MRGYDAASAGRKAPKLLGLAAAAAFSLCTLRAEADGLRCGNKLISKGDPAVELLHYCGKPDSVSSRIVQRGVFRFGRFLPGFVEEVTVEDWTYNFGPSRLMRKVRVIDGIVDDVEQLGYGYSAPPPP